MHNFHELISRSTAFTLDALKEANNQLVNSLQENASTSLIKNLQMIQLQRVILTVGMFSIFDSELQRTLKCRNGFKKAKEILRNIGELDLEKQFEDYILAINILKHGRGKSYDALIKRIDLPIEVNTQDSTLYVEGDVSQLNTLINIDDTFITSCAELITQVSNALIK